MTQKIEASLNELMEYDKKISALRKEIKEIRRIVEEIPKSKNGELQKRKNREVLDAD